MTIRKGEPWGSPTERPAGLLLLGSDAAVASALDADPTQDVGVCGGDLHRSLGRPAERTEMQRLPIDAFTVTLDGSHYTGVAHVIARRAWWSGPIVAVMNVDHLGEWYVAPRAHPNDGRLDVVEVDASMTRRERWQARSRLGSGTHVPHPKIRVRTVTDETWRFGRPCSVWVDGFEVADVGSMTVRVRPDAFAVVV